MFSKILKDLSMFSHAPKTKIASRILHVTDSEGNQASFLSAIENSKTVKFHPDNGLSFHNTKEIPYFIFGGDATDRGNSDLFLSQLLLDFKQHYPEQVFLLVGNRDVTKNRFKIELDARLIRTRLLNSQSPRWLQQPTEPLDYLNKEMMEQKFSGSALDYVYTLSVEQCQLIYLKWMLEKTMGCPHSFRYRKEELKRAYPNTVISDVVVLHSFIKESSNTGINSQYLQHAQVGVIVPDTGVMAVHGGLQPNNIGKIPGMQGKPIQDARVWITQFNNWYKQQIQNWMEYQPTELNVPAFTKLDECVLPLPNQVKSIITADMLDPNGQFINIPIEVSDYLLQNEIQLLLTGHQPGGDHPMILQDDRLLCINGDTGYAAFNPKDVDNTRGGATHTLEILTDEQGAHIDLKATLPNKTKVRTQMSIFANTIEGDHYVGLITPEHELVQCRLPNGNYRLAYKEGLHVTYSELTASELSKRIWPSNPPRFE